MGIFTLTIDCAGDAFTPPADEIARLLRFAADRVEAGHTEGRLVDVNGNTAGGFDLYDENAEPVEDADVG